MKCMSIITSEKLKGDELSKFSLSNGSSKGMGTISNSKRKAGLAVFIRMTLILFRAFAPL